MRRPGCSKSLLPGSAILAIAAGLLFAPADLHSLLHVLQDPASDARAHGDPHPQPAHLDHASVDFPCPVCLLGLKSQSRPAEGPAVNRPQARDRLAAAPIASGVAELSYRLPLSRAPPPV